MKTILTVALSFLIISAYAQETTPVRLTLSAVYTVAGNQITQYTGVDKGCINIELHANGTFTYSTEGGPLGRVSTSLGAYNLVGDKLQLNYDNGTTQQYTILRLDNIYTKLIAGERVMYFIKSKASS
jgi:hypothetical protein